MTTLTTEDNAFESSVWTVYISMAVLVMMFGILCPWK